MKRLAAILLVLFTVVATMLVVNGAGETFSVTVSGDAVVPAGETVTYTITIGEVASEKGLRLIETQVTYNTAMFEYVSCEADTEKTTVSDWDLGFAHSDGAIDFNLCDNGLFGTTNNALTTGKSIVFTLKLKVKDSAASSGEVKVTAAVAGESIEGGQSEVGTVNSLSIALKQKLATPTGLVWDGSVAKWDAVENASGYSVQAYKEGKAMGDAQIASGTSFDFKNELTEGGKYTFTVIAVSDQPEFEDGNESEQSSGFYTVVGTLATPKIKLTQDLLNGGLEFLITDTNAAGTVLQYVVEIYEKGSDTAVETLQTGDKDGNFVCDGEKIVAGKSYVATVTALSANTDVNNNSKKSAKTEAVEALEKVTSIKFKTTPTLTYKEGDKLDLSGMVITLTYQSGATKDVAFKDFLTNGLTASMENGKELNLGDNGQAITVFYGVSISATSPNLTVESGTCAHKNTAIDRKEPTCGVDGHEKITCKDCGATVSDTVLNATEKHSYGEWTVMAEPQVNIKGYQERTCSVCSHRDVQEIPALLPGETTTNNGGTTTPPTTDDPEDPEDPDETGDDFGGEGDDDDDVGSNMSDLSRVFLTIVIIIFSLAVLFIVGGYWMQSRRNKARAARRNRRPPNRR